MSLRTDDIVGFRHLDVMGGLIRNVIHPIWARRDHPYFASYLRAFEKTQYLSHAELQQIQVLRARDLFSHAYMNCPFYRRLMINARFDPAKLSSIEDVSVLPLLTKRHIQDFGPDLKAANMSEMDPIHNQTGGSTGSPLQFLVDRKRFDSRYASTIRHDRWAGVRVGDWKAVLWGARLDQLLTKSWWDHCRNTFLYRAIELNTSSIRKDDWRAFIAAIRKQQPRTLVAYAQSAALFAKYIQEHNISDIAFESVITTAEVLMPADRAVIEKTFHCRVFNRYGCREVSVIASECEQHTGMHINAEALLVEIVPDPAIPPPAGKIVITDLFNYSMPLIRYEIGDVGSFADIQACSCGRGLPLLAQVNGRTTDFLTLPDGRKISGPALTLVVADMADVRQVQFVQRASGHITLRVVPGRDYGAHTALELRKRLSLYLEQMASLDIEEVDGIASEVSGKV